MTRELRQLLEAQRAITEDLQRRHNVVCRHVFHREGRPIRSFRVAFRTACVRAGCPGRVLHDLRRTTATRMAEDIKIAPHVVDKILNHSTGVVKGVAAIYNRAELLDERRDALAAWSRYVNELVRGAPSNVVSMREAVRT